MEESRAKEILRLVTGADEDGIAKATVHIKIARYDNAINKMNDIRQDDVMYDAVAMLERHGSFVDLVLEDKQRGIQSSEFAVLQEKINLFIEESGKDAKNAEDGTYEENVFLIIDLVPNPVTDGFVRLVNPVFYGPIAQPPAWKCTGYRVTFLTENVSVLELAEPVTADEPLE